MHPLTEVILLYDEQAFEEKCEADVARLAELLEAEPSLDSHILLTKLVADLNVVPHRTVELIRRANCCLSEREPLALEPIVEHLREAKLVHVAAMEAIVKETTLLRQAFRDPWFDELRSIIRSWNPESGFHLPTHTAFMGYYTDLICFGGTFLLDLEDALRRLAGFGPISQKLRETAGPASGFVSTVFEVLVLRAFALAEVIESFEPTLPGGGKGEARVRLGEQSVLIEARVKMDEERAGGFFDPKDMATKLFLKVQEKYVGQYAGIQEPLIVFFSLGVSVLQDIEIDALLDLILEDGAATSLSGIVFCDFYQPRDMRFWPNPKAAQPLSDDATAGLFHHLPVRPFSASKEELPSSHAPT